MTGGIFPLRSGHGPAAVATPAAAGTMRFAVSIALLAWGAAVQAMPAQDMGRMVLPEAQVRSPVSTRIGGRPQSAPCVQVDIAGHKAGNVDCAAEALDAAAKAAQARAIATPDLAVPSVTSADTVTGVTNKTATRQRMGNQFGKGVRPQRPPPPVFAPRSSKP